MFDVVQEIRRGERENTGILELISGSAFLVWYFRAMGCVIGENVCLYPNGGDPMMTEPDMVNIGDNCCVDNASLIAHINTRGYFRYTILCLYFHNDKSSIFVRLNPIDVGSGCVLKSNTRLLSGSGMENNSILLEHTLVISGDRVDAGSVWQGWPSEVHTPLREHRQGVTNLLSNRDLDLMSIFLSTNSASSLATVKRRRRRRRAEKAELTARGSERSGETSGFLTAAARPSPSAPKKGGDGYSRLADDDL
jgi:acetyltransferase-like isoleucine patch superfamily enzyme